MKNELTSDRPARAENFKRPCWRALYASLGAMLAGYVAYYGMFPLGSYAADRPWRALTENLSLLLLASGILAFVASLVWWIAAAIGFRRRSPRPQPRAALAALSGLGLVAALCLLGGNLQAQDDSGGGPGGAPPVQPGDGGPGGPGGPGDGGDNGGPGGPSPGNVDNGGSGGARSGFDPAQFQQRMLEQTRKSLVLTNSEEWTAIQPLIQKVMEARREIGGGMGMPGPGGPGRPGGPGDRGRGGPPASSEHQALQKLLDDGSPTPQIKDALANFRAARKSKQAKLETAQADLKAVLSVKQEAQAVLLGLLP